MTDIVLAIAIVLLSSLMANNTVTPAYTLH